MLKASRSAALGKTTANVYQLEFNSLIAKTKCKKKLKLIFGFSKLKDYLLLFLSQGLKRVYIIKFFFIRKTEAIPEKLVYENVCFMILAGVNGVYILRREMDFFL